MPKHAWIQEHLATYIAGGLDTEETERLESHVASCPNCAKLLDELRAADQTLAALFTGVMPEAGMEDRVIQRLRNARPPRWPNLMRYGRMAAAVAAVFLVGLVGTCVNDMIRDDRVIFPDSERIAQLIGQSNAKGQLSPGASHYSQNKPFSFKEDSRASNGLTRLMAKTDLESKDGLQTSPPSDAISVATMKEARKQRPAKVGSITVSGNDVTREDVVREQVGQFPGQKLTYADVNGEAAKSDSKSLAKDLTPKGGDAQASSLISNLSDLSSLRNFGDEDADPFPPEPQKGLGYYSPSRAVVTKGTSSTHTNTRCRGRPASRCPQAIQGHAIS